MNIDPKDYQVKPDKKIQLKNWPTIAPAFYKSNDQYQTRLQADVKELSGLQKLLYASNAYSVLLILQAIDAAGKDGAIGHVLTGINPQGCEVKSFKTPSAEELSHDFLWRSTRSLPARGRIGVFNRSYYEEVLVVRVHPELLLNEGILDKFDEDESFWEKRFTSISNLERHLYRNRTRVVKIFLHLSKEEQRKRFLARIDDPDKNWKFSMADIQERKFWNQYRTAYEECLSHTSSKHAPWYVVPADDKLNARLIISRIVIQTLSALSMRYPQSTPERQKELKAIKAELLAAG